MSNQTNGAVGGFWLTSGVGSGSAKILPYVAVATINAADPAGLTDGFGAALSVDQTGRLRVQLSGVNTPVVPPNTAIFDGLGVTGRAVAPGAGGAIATLVTPPGGLWELNVRAWLDAGAPAAADINNMELREGAVVRSAIGVLPVINVYPSVFTFRLNLDGATNVSVNATGAATAGVGYTAQISMWRLV